MISERKRILVTGASGLVGQPLVAQLLRLGWQVRGLTRSPNKASELEKMGCEAVVGDIRDGQAIAQAVSGAHSLIHLVAILRPWRDLTYGSITAEGTEKIVLAAKRAGVERFIYVSALGVSAADTNPYMSAKWRAEEAVRASGLNYTIFRPSYLYGKNSHFLKLLEQLTRLPIIPVVGHGRQKLQIMWVENLADCVVASLRQEASYNKTYEMGGPEALEFNEVLNLMCLIKGRPPRLKLTVPYAIVKPFAALGAKLIPSLPATPETLELLLRDNICDVSYVQKTFGVQLVSFAQGLKKVLG